MSFERTVVLSISITFLLYITTNALERSNRFTVKLNVDLKEFVEQTLKNYNFSLLYEITPEILIIDYKENDGRGYEMLDTLSKEYPEQIVRWEQVRVYVNTLKPADTGVEEIMQPHLNVTNENYYGLGIGDAWRRGYSGKEIVIAVADVGIDIDLLDLKKNVNRDLSHNFVKDINNVTPENFPKNQVSASNLTDHGNSVTSIIAAEQGNGICSDGIAYNVTIAGYKVFEVKVKGDIFDVKPSHWTASDIIARALTYKLNDIDIFVSAWSSTIPFDRLDLPISEAIRYCALKGRNSFGTVILVPAGPVGNVLSNNIHTITVGSVGQYGNVPSYAFTDASVITSGLSDGSNLTADTMVTASFCNKCVTSFKGSSAATAQVAGIIALGLEANPYMSLRAIQHVLILASDHEGLKDSIAFRRNGANRHVHGVFGYGLLNADKFVTLAAGNKKILPNLLNVILHMKRHHKVSPLREEFEACFDCPSVITGECLTSVEQVVISVGFKIVAKNLQIEVISPSGTQSVLMDEKHEDHKDWEVERGKLVSTHFWDEKSIGVWRVIIQHKHINDFVHIKNVSITIFGTYRTKYNRLEYIDLCSNERVTTEQSNIPNPEINIVDNSIDKSINVNSVINNNVINTEGITWTLFFFILGGVMVVGIIGLIVIIIKGGSQGPLADGNTHSGTSMAQTPPAQTRPFSRPRSATI